MSKPTKHWTALDLLEAIFEFEAMTPDTSQWHEDKLRWNPPRHIRFLRLKALLSAFGFDRIDTLSNRIHYLKSGDFIRDNNLDTYAEIVSLIRQYDDRGREVRTMDIYVLYQVLIKHKQAARTFLHTNNYMEAGMIGVQYGLSIIHPSKQALTDQLNQSKMDELLGQILDPYKRSISEQELIKDYRFPKDDLDAIDIDHY